MTRSIETIALAAIRPGDNDRTEFAYDDLLELAQSIAQIGLQQPISVRPLDEPDGAVLFEIMAGERRYHAHVLYNEQVRSGEWEPSPHVAPDAIQAIISADIDDEHAATVMLIENIQRKDLSPLDEANAYQKRIDQFGWSVTKLARTAGKSPGLVKSRLDLLRLCPEAQQMLKNGDLQLQFAQELIDLNSTFQRSVIRWLGNQTYVPSLPYFRKFVNGQRDIQDQEALFDMGEIMTATAVRVAEDPNLRVSDTLPSLAHLPPLPQSRGNPGAMIDSYIAALIEGGHAAEARVLLDFWRKMMKCNKLQVKPWDSHVLPLLDNGALAAEQN